MVHHLTGGQMLLAFRDGDYVCAQTLVEEELFHSISICYHLVHGSTLVFMNKNDFLPKEDLQHSLLSSHSPER